MAIATLTITDIDIDSGQVEITCKIEDSLTDDGQMTAAEVMLRVLHSDVSSGAFRTRVWAEIDKLKNASQFEVANDQHDPRKVG